MLVADKARDASGVAFAALVTAMLNQGQHAVLRLVRTAREVRIGWWLSGRVWGVSRLLFCVCCACCAWRGRCERWLSTLGGQPPHAASCVCCAAPVVHGPGGEEWVVGWAGVNAGPAHAVCLSKLHSAEPACWC